MAFNRTDPADLAALKTEATTDPIGMGYDVNGSTQQLLSKLNDAANNVGGETVAQEITADVLLSVIDWDDYASNPVGIGGRGLTDNLIQYGTATGASLESWRQKLRAAYQPNSATVQALDALVRPLSRAEVLFGEGTTITRDDWFAARDS